MSTFRAVVYKDKDAFIPELPNATTYIAHCLELDITGSDISKSGAVFKLAWDIEELIQNNIGLAIQFRQAPKHIRSLWGKDEDDSRWYIHIDVNARYNNYYG